MAKKNKSNNNIQISNKENIVIDKEQKEIANKEGYRITLKTKTFIIIDKYGINVKIKLSSRRFVLFIKD